MLYRFWQFPRHAQIEQYLFSVPMILKPPQQPFPVSIRLLPYLHTDLKSRNLMGWCTDSAGQRNPPFNPSVNTQRRPSGVIAIARACLSRRAYWFDLPSRAD
jgi:hypothetical protein